MPHRLAIVADNDTSQRELTVQLLDGFAEVMGDGIFVIFQEPSPGVVISTVLTEDDMRRMLAAS